MATAIDMARGVDSDALGERWAPPQLPGADNVLVPELTVEGLATVLATIEDNPFIPHSPEPPQIRFLACDAREALYGGAAGGGKSDALLMKALQYATVPGYAALLLMKTYKDLTRPAAPIPRSHEWLAGTGARYNQTEHRWHFPSGATLDFGYLQYPTDAYNYKTAEYNVICWEEATMFDLWEYLYLFSRQRRAPDCTIPLQTRSGANPEGPGYDWVKERFVVEGALKGRPFVPALLGDNPHVDQASYRESLSHLPPLEKARLLRGNWSIRPTGHMFKRHWFEIVKARPAPVDVEVRSWDMAATEPKGPSDDPDHTAGGRIAVKDGVYYIDRLVLERVEPAATRRLLRQAAVLDGPNVLIIREQEPGAAGKEVVDDCARTTLKGYPFKAERVTGSKVERATPLAVASSQGLVKLVEGPYVEDFLDQAVVFGSKGAFHDDLIDMASLGFNEARKQVAFTAEAL